MQLLQLVLLLLTTFTATSSTIAVIPDQAHLEQSKPRTDNSEIHKAAYRKDDGTSNLGSEASEARGLTSLFSKMKRTSGKNIGLGTRIGSMRKNSNVATALERNPVVKRMASDPEVFTKLQKNPGSLKKLAKDPQVAQVAVTLEKANAKISKSDVKQLRTIASKDPAKARILDSGLSLLEGLMAGAFMVVTAGLVLFLFGVIISAITP